MDGILRQHMSPVTSFSSTGWSLLLLFWLSFEFPERSIFLSLYMFLFFPRHDLFFWEVCGILGLELFACMYIHPFFFAFFWDGLMDL